MSDNVARIVSIVLHPLLMPILVFVTIFYFVPVAIKPFPGTDYIRVLSVIFILTYVIPLLSVSMLRLNHVVYAFKSLMLQIKGEKVADVSGQDVEMDDLPEPALMENNNNINPEDSEEREGLIEGLLMEKKEERLVPFAFITIYYALCTYFFISQERFNDIFFIIPGSITLTLLIITIVTTRWKISTHAAGSAGYLGFILAVNRVYPGNQLLYPVLFGVLMCGLIMSSRLQRNAHNANEVYAGFFLGFVISFAAIYYLV